MTDDKFDLILDAALRDYSNREPSAGFERRILLHNQAIPRRLNWKFGWALAAITLAVVVLRFDLPKNSRCPRSRAL